jgi:lipopolysaccharide biosynthesis protein
MGKVRAIALYLPQFHPIPENDEWWGRGFTEWTNVTKARPLFRSHYQPHLPADLGFCDLRSSDVRLAQAELARAHGIDAFCYYHYWFSGRRLLNRPFDDVLRLGEPSLPFCLCWANESWSRRWLGEEKEILIRQEYSADDDEAHGRFLAHAFADPRYVRHHGRPLFLVWRPKHRPEPRATVDRIAAAVEREGLPRPFFMGVDSHCPGTDCRDLGFDATMTFAPQLGYLPGALSDRFSGRRLLRNLRKGVADGRLKIYEYDDVIASLRGLRSGARAAPCAVVGWDNTPRRGEKGVVVLAATPEQFGADLRTCVALAKRWDADEPLVFINAWNEWAEGCHLEPDQARGRAYLEQVRSVMLEGS